MFIQTEPTPNPATLKFLPGRPVLASGTLDMRDKEAAAQSPLAERLFEIPGISGVFFGVDFVAVTKTTGEWQQLKPAILGAIMEHFMSGAPFALAFNRANGGSEIRASALTHPRSRSTAAKVKLCASLPSTPRLRPARPPCSTPTAGLPPARLWP